MENWRKESNVNELGFKEIDKDKHKKQEKQFKNRLKMRTGEFYILFGMYAIMWIFSIWLGIKSINDRSYLSRFITSVTVLVYIAVVSIGTIKFLEWFLKFIFKKQNSEKLIKQSQRNLKNVLNIMNAHVGEICWNALWICIIITKIILDLCTETVNIKNFLKSSIYMLIIYAFGYIVIKAIRNKRNLTKKMLKCTKVFYNYGDEELYVKYVDWSIKEHLLILCKQYMLTEEFFLGYANSDVGFSPVVIPREFIKNSEMRVELSWNGNTSVSRLVLACQLNNNKVVNFYLSRFCGNQMAIDLLKKKGFQFTLREDIVDYQ